jgi:hypothetical protein
VFASTLLTRRWQQAPGTDLPGHEAKSVLDAGNYEYQYHKNTGKDKLKRDMVAHGGSMKEFFATWLAEYPDPYPQRYRKNIPFYWIKKNGILLMTLSDGEVTYPPTAKSTARS